MQLMYTCSDILTLGIPESRCIGMTYMQPSVGDISTVLGANRLSDNSATCIQIPQPRLRLDSLVKDFPSIFEDNVLFFYF